MLSRAKTQHLTLRRGRQKSNPLTVSLYVIRQLDVRCSRRFLLASTQFNAMLQAPLHSDCCRRATCAPCAPTCWVQVHAAKPLSSRSACLVQYDDACLRTSEHYCDTQPFMSSFAKEWEDCRREYTGAGSPSIVVVKGLRHSSAYVFRLSGLNQNGTFDGPGRECTFHTRGAIEQGTEGRGVHPVFWVDLR